MTSDPNLDRLYINTIRTLAMDAVQKANSGHPGTPMALAPVVQVLWDRFLRFHPANPNWVNRDRFILSCGHVVRHDEAVRGVIIWGSGVGVTVTANKLPGIRAGICHDSYSAHQGVEHDDMNVLCLGARMIGRNWRARSCGALPRPIFRRGTARPQVRKNAQD